MRRWRGGWFLRCFSSFRSVSERGEISGGLGVCVGGLVDFLYEGVWGGGLWISGALARGSLRWRQGLMPLGSGGRLREWSVSSEREETGCLELLLRAPRCGFCCCAMVVEEERCSLPWVWEGLPSAAEGEGAVAAVIFFGCLGEGCGGVVEFVEDTVDEDLTEGGFGLRIREEGSLGLLRLLGGLCA